MHSQEMCAADTPKHGNQAQGSQQNSPQNSKSSHCSRSRSNNQFGLPSSADLSYLQIEGRSFSAPLPASTGRWRKPGVGDRVVSQQFLPAAELHVRRLPKNSRPRLWCSRCSTPNAFGLASCYAPSWQALTSDSARPARQPMGSASSSRPCRGDAAGGNRSLTFHAKMSRSGIGQIAEPSLHSVPRTTRRQPCRPPGRFSDAAGFLAPTLQPWQITLREVVRHPNPPHQNRKWRP